MKTALGVLTLSVAMTACGSSERPEFVARELPSIGQAPASTPETAQPWAEEETRPPDDPAKVVLPTLEQALTRAATDAAACRALGRFADARALATLKALTAPEAELDGRHRAGCWQGLVDMWWGPGPTLEGAYHLTLERLAAAPAPPWQAVERLGLPQAVVPGFVDRAEVRGALERLASAPSSGPMLRRAATAASSRWVSAGVNAR